MPPLLDGTPPAARAPPGGERGGSLSPSLQTELYRSFGLPPPSPRSAGRTGRPSRSPPLDSGKTMLTCNQLFFLPSQCLLLNGENFWLLDSCVRTTGAPKIVSLLNPAFVYQALDDVTLKEYRPRAGRRGAGPRPAPPPSSAMSGESVTRLLPPTSSITKKGWPPRSSRSGEPGVPPGVPAGDNAPDL